ncbi:MAG: hypothetical protein R3A51_02265 [Nannocystaceae bacterium]
MSAPPTTALFAALRAHGWRQEGATLFAPGRTLWLETIAYPPSVASFLEDLRSRRRRRLRARERFPPEELAVTLPDVESALRAAEGLGGARGRASLGRSV